MYVQAHVCSFHDGAAELPSLMLLLLPETGSTPAFLHKYSTLWFSVTFSILSSCWWYSLWLWCKAEFKQRSVLTARLNRQWQEIQYYRWQKSARNQFLLKLQIPPSFQLGCQKHTSKLFISTLPCICVYEIRLHS